MTFVELVRQEFKCKPLSSLSSVTADIVQLKSQAFWNIFPSNTARIHMLLKVKDKKELESKLNSVYPIITEGTVRLIIEFLSYKRTHGSRPERALYKNMNGIQFVDRLLRKRPLSFLGERDFYLLRQTFKRGKGGFEKIGTDNEKHPLLLKDYLSFDEMKISALMSVSSQSFFVNNGSRKNKGIPGKPRTFENEGVIVGQVGARMKKRFYMEYQDCVVDPTQNTHTHVIRNGLLRIWEKFWDVKIPVYSEANGVKFLDIGNKLYLNAEVLIKRMEIPASILLNEADARAKAARKKAYIHVVGLGLGVWRISDIQEELFLEAWAQALTETRVTNVAVVDFSWINGEKCGQASNGGIFPGTEITVKFSKRNLHDRVPNGHLLVCSYAWDSNAYPGNEFWLGKLASTGDCAAACSSCIAEFHNAELNPRVSSAGLCISTDKGLLHINDYVGQVISEEPSKEVDMFIVEGTSVKHQVDQKESSGQLAEDNGHSMSQEVDKSGSVSKKIKVKRTSGVVECGEMSVPKKMRKD